MDLLKKMMKFMDGKKTNAGCVLIAIASAIWYTGNSKLAILVLGVGGALGLIGAGHKLEKLKDIMKIANGEKLKK